MVEVVNDFAPQIQKQLTELKSALSTDLPKINAALKKAGAAEIVPSSVDVAKLAASYTY
jgi:hypothetical protein